MATGMVSRWRKGKDIRNIISKLKEIFDCNYYYELMEAVEKCVQDRNYYRKMSFKFANDLNRLRAEFRKKRVHYKSFKIILNIKKTKPHKQYKGVLYFHKSLIGTKVVVWRKD